MKKICRTALIAAFSATAVQGLQAGYKNCYLKALSIALVRQ